MLLAAPLDLFVTRPTHQLRPPPSCILHNGCEDPLRGRGCSDPRLYHLHYTLPSDGSGQAPPQSLGHASASLGSSLGGFEQSSHRQKKLYVAERGVRLSARGRVVSMYEVNICTVINDKDEKKRKPICLPLPPVIYHVWRWLEPLALGSRDLSRIAGTQQRHSGHTSD
jgi:hypothetical protein